ncbi:hypothetical protein O9X80_23255 [Agrobacterium salinitolerans]|uniref:hypothetical protein n=1 Tax=Agrobacterium salinitolerans TaxID=1183413 RepID=UPI0022B82EB2|nr:hypothetical protein [Agrobacterium salinitolerans]MCZ7977422.1 hypothetical protein [Agrobacterium salinitolerans]
MTTTKTHKIEAKFGGQELVFELPRSDLDIVEAMIDETLNARLQRIVHGVASVADVTEILEMAAPPGKGSPIFKRSDMSHIAIKRSLAKLKPLPQTFVAKTLIENGPMKYAVLAQGVIAAALFGVPESASTFDENEEADG